MKSARKKPWKQVKTQQGIKYKYDFQDLNWNIKRIKRTFNTAEEAQSFHEALLKNAMTIAKGEQIERTFGDAMVEFIQQCKQDRKLSLGLDLSNLNTLRWPFDYQGKFYRLEDLPLHDREFGIIWGIKKYKQNMAQIIKRSRLHKKIYHCRREENETAWYIQPDPSDNQKPAPRYLVTDPVVLKQLNDTKGLPAFASDTLIRRFSLVKTILHTAWHDWRWLTNDLSALIKQDKPNKGRIAFLTGQQFDNLIKVSDQFFGYLIRGGKAIGWRKSNLIGLTWDRVIYPEYLTDEQGNPIKIPGYLRVEKFDNSDPALDPLDLTQRRNRTKNKDDLETIMTSEIEDLLRELDKHRVPGSNVVFHNGHGDYWGSFRKRWTTAKKRAGISAEFRWHDLRHTWATDRINEGVPENIIMEEQGWKHPQMVKRYGHLKREARYKALKEASGN